MSHCTSLTTQLKNLTQLHTDLEELLTDLDQEFTPQKLANAHNLKEQIKQCSRELEQQTKESVDLVLKEKFTLDWNGQLGVYTERDQEEWVDDIRDHKQSLINKLKDPKNKFAIQEKLKHNMMPILMPGREVQRRTWNDSLTNLKPYWRELNKKTGVIEEKTVNESSIWPEGYTALLDNPQKWEHIPNEPYIVWVEPTQRVSDKTTTQRYEQQETTLKSMHTKNPELYDTHDIHPVEYAALQAMHTSLHRDRSDTQKVIVPLDYFGLEGTYSYNRFISLGGLPVGGVAFVLLAFFLPGDAQVLFGRVGLNSNSDSGFRAVGRL